MNPIVSIPLADAKATEALGKRLASACTTATIVYLQGDLGAGKTTLTRGFLSAFGHQGAVKSPTYTLIEPYQFASQHIYHLDLYRLGDPEELEYLGLRDLLEAPGHWLVEWPERGLGFLPAADVDVHLGYAGQARIADLHALSAVGGKLLQQLV